MVYGEPNNPVGAVQYTSRILEIVKQSHGATLTEISEGIDLSKSSIYNYLSTLESEHLLVQDGDEYYLGLRCLDLGTIALERWQIHETAQPEIQELAEDTEEVVNLMVEEYGLGIYVCREFGKQALRYEEYTGYRSTMHNSAAGKCLLSHLPENKVEQILDYHGMEQTAPNTITTRGELFEELSDIHEQGIAFDDEECLPGTRCVAAPICDNKDQIRGAISVTGPKSRLQGDVYRTTIPNQIRDKVNIIELKLLSREYR